MPAFGADDGWRSRRATGHRPQRPAVRALFCPKPSGLRLLLVAGFITRFHTADDRKNAPGTEVSSDPSKRFHPQARTIIRQRGAGRLDQPGPALCVARLVASELLEDLGALGVLFGGRHHPVERDALHLDEIVLAETDEIRLGWRVA